MNELFRRLLALPVQASSVAHDIDALHYFVITITMLGSLVIGVTALVFLVRYARKPGDGRTPKVIVAGWLEFIWIGGLLCIFLLWWVIGYYQYMDLNDPPEDSLEVYVVGKQWMWKFAYPDGRNSIARLTVPAGRSVRLNMTSRDVIHSFFVPAFRIKQDVIPGRYTSVWFNALEPGEYAILCTEYCGLGHSAMRGVVVALNPRDYQRWLELGETQGDALVTGASRPGILDAFEFSQMPADADVLSRPERTMADYGREAAANHGCLACHTIDGTRHIGPSWRGLYGSSVEMVDGTRVLADESYLTESMMDPRAQIVAGYAPIMPTYWGILSATDSAAIVEYIKTLRGVQRDEVFPDWPLENLQAPEDRDGRGGESDG